MKNEKLTHTNNNHEVRMVNISDKPKTPRYARAKSTVILSKKLLALLKENKLAKGDALSAARIAGIQAAKRTSELIPLCHPLPLTDISVDIKLIDEPPSVEIITQAKTVYKTGVEMEALTAAAVAALTIYDMGKSVERGMVIESIKLLKKSGGKSAEWSN